MDHDHKGYARELGIFDLTTNEARVVQLPATCWHIAPHPTKDFFYGPSQQVAPQGREFGEYTLAHFKNYVFEVDAETATPSLAMPPSPRSSPQHSPPTWRSRTMTSFTTRAPAAP